MLAIDSSTLTPWIAQGYCARKIPPGIRPIARVGIVLEDALDAGDRLIDADAMDRAGILRAEDPARHQAH
ncbi:hypothetical protein, partial [Acinetobacter baumannii]|uniref:hypothetical protein n=1 Tax=Acinetobacter baumannii TaxID=470 RepID=UPI001D171ECD